MAQTFPENLLSQVEFDKIAADLASRCTGLPAQEDVLSLAPLASSHEVIDELRICGEMQSLAQSHKVPGVELYRSLDKALSLLEKEGYVASSEDCLEIRNQLDQIIGWQTFIKDLQSDVDIVLIRQFVLGVPINAELSALLHQVFDKQGIVHDHASADLGRIRANIRVQQRAIDKSFAQELARYKKLGFLTDSNESVRNGRRVLTVKSEAKRKVKGILHDTSSTGRTFFIEPDSVLFLNNELLELYNEESAEIHRILFTVSERLREDLLSIHDGHKFLIRLDVLTAKVSQARVLGAIAPKLTDDRIIEIHKGRHPLLVLKNQGHSDRVISFDLKLDQQNRLLIISGPNAGGKTITLKAVGLMQVMVQCGLMVPVAPESTMTCFEKLCADIGDQQSLEEDLSTYSSHLKNMQMFLQNADGETLILLDELGSGTDPLIGGALAESILLQLTDRKALGIITTHYGNLKVLASNTPGMINGSMDFDQKELIPTYHLQTGTPGSSYAFEMAKRSGLDQKVIDRARRLAGQKGANLEDLLVTLQQQKDDLDVRLQAAQDEKRNLDRLIKTYENLRRELDVRRKKLKLKEKTSQIATTSASDSQLQKLISELREKEKLSEAKKLAAKLRDEKKRLSSEVQELREDIVETSLPKDKKPFAIGDHVRMKMGGLAGRIVKKKKNKVTIEAGNVTLDASVDDIVHSKETIETNPTRTVQTRLEPFKEVHHRLDIRGLRKAEAIGRIEKFIDKALIANLPLVEIIHGKGYGTLRSAVQATLESYDQKFESWHPEPAQGGEGVTLVRFAN